VQSGWTSGCGPAAAALTGARGNSTALAGTPEQVSDAVLDYYDLGVTTFLIRGFEPQKDAIDYGLSLLPATWHVLAARSAGRVAAE
jgi:alkanesulfonate monooxygenase